MRKLTAILFLTLNSCCTPTILPEVIAIPILPLPTLPGLTSEQKEAIELDTFLILVERETKLKLHIEKVNELIKLHN